MLEQADYGGTEPLDEGERIGRYVTIRDADGVLHAVAPSSIAAVCETPDGTLLLLPGGRMVQVCQSLRKVLRWLEVGGSLGRGDTQSLR